MLFFLFSFLIYYVYGKFPPNGIEVPWMSSHRNNLLDVKSTTKEWNMTFKGNCQWTGTFTFVNDFLAFTIQDSQSSNNLVYLVNHDTGETITDISVKPWTQIQGSLTPRPPNGYYMYVINGQKGNIQVLNVNDATIINWDLVTEHSMYFDQDMVLYETDVIYFDHGGPCRGGRSLNSTSCSWLYSYQLDHHFNKWIIMDIPDMKIDNCVTKDFNEILYLMDTPPPLKKYDNNHRLWKINAKDGKVNEIVDFKDEYSFASENSPKLSVSNIDTPSELNNYYFVQKLVTEVIDGWFLFGFSKDNNTNTMYFSLGDAADLQDGCYEVTISEDAKTVYVSCQRDSDMLNTVFSIDVSTGKQKFKKEMTGYQSCKFVSETMNNKVVVTCAQNYLTMLDQKRRRRRRRRTNNDIINGGEGILILNGDDGTILEKIDFGSSDVYVGIRPMLDSSHNLYYCYYYGENQQMYTTCTRKSLA